MSTGASLHRFSVAEYQRMVELGFFNEARVELLDGIIYSVPPLSPQHAYVLQSLLRRLHPIVQPNWHLRTRSDVPLSTSQPDPGISIAVERGREYARRHPGAADVRLIVEVLDPAFEVTRYKREIYARDNIPVYWIVNLIARQVEVYTHPAGLAYAHQDTYTPSMTVPVVLDGVAVGHLAVDDLLP